MVFRGDHRGLRGEVGMLVVRGLDGRGWRMSGCGVNEGNVDYMPRPWLANWLY